MEAHSPKLPLERLHALTGVAPLALFTLLHLLLQAAALGGGDAYALVARFSAGWVWSGIAVLLAYLPLAIHSAVGFWLMFRGASGSTETRERRQSRLIVSLSGLGVLAFLGSHWLHFRYPMLIGELRPAQLYTEMSASLSSTTKGGVPLVALAYVLGVAATMIHLYYGFYRFLEGFGIADDPARLRQISLGQRAAYAVCCIGFGFGTATIVQLATGSLALGLW